MEFTIYYSTNVVSYKITLRFMKLQLIKIRVNLSFIDKNLMIK